MGTTNLKRMINLKNQLVKKIQTVTIMLRKRLKLTQRTKLLVRLRNERSRTDLNVKRGATLRKVGDQWKTKRKLVFQWWDRREDHRKDWLKVNPTRKNQRATKTNRGKWSFCRAKFDEKSFIELHDPIPTSLNKQT
jgi:hypothetical protein